MTSGKKMPVSGPILFCPVRDKSKPCKWLMVDDVGNVRHPTKAEMRGDVPAPVGNIDAPDQQRSRSGDVGRGKLNPATGMFEATTDPGDPEAAPTYLVIGQAERAVRDVRALETIRGRGKWDAVARKYRDFRPEELPE